MKTTKKLEKATIKMKVIINKKKAMVAGTRKKVPSKRTSQLRVKMSRKKSKKVKRSKKDPEISEGNPEEASTMETEVTEELGM